MKGLIVIGLMMMLVGCTSSVPSADIDNVEVIGNSITFDVNTSNGEMIEDYALRMYRGDTHVHTFTDDELNKDGLMYDVSIHALSPGEHTIEAYAQYDDNGETISEVIGSHTFTFELPEAAPTVAFTDVDLEKDRIDFSMDVEDPEAPINRLSIMLYDDEGNALVEISDSEVQSLSFLQTLTYNKALYFHNLQADTDYTIHIYGDFDVDEAAFKWVIMDVYHFTTDED